LEAKERKPRGKETEYLKSNKKNSWREHRIFEIHGKENQRKGTIFES
jgi:hypothetical protein